MAIEISSTRGLSFLQESSLIANIHIDLPQIPDKGYFGAFLQSQSAAANKQPITLPNLLHWQTLIIQEQVDHGYPAPIEGIGKIRSQKYPINISIAQKVTAIYEEVPKLLEVWIDDLNQQLHNFRPQTVKTVEILGDFFQRFETIHPFVSGNGRMARLLINYIATWCNLPILIFRENEQNQMSTRSFMALKIQETVRGISGQNLSKVKDFGSSALYRSDDGREKVIVEWHELQRAMTTWLKKS